jgi:hypothetical protein
MVVDDTSTLATAKAVKSAGSWCDVTGRRFLLVKWAKTNESRSDSSQLVPVALEFISERESGFDIFAQTHDVGIRSRWCAS